MKEALTAREFARTLNRMCGETKCSECPLFADECDITVAKPKEVDKIVDVVTKWAKENPETKAEFPDELIVKLKPWDEVLAWGEEHLGHKGPDMVYGIFKTTYERDLYNKELHVKKDRDPDPKGFAVYQLIDAPYLFIPEAFIAEGIEVTANEEEKPKPKVYPKHCIVKLVPYKEATKREMTTALPEDPICHVCPWGISKDAYDILQSETVELSFCRHRDMNDGVHSIYRVCGYRAYFIPDIFIDEVLQDLDGEE